MAGAFNNTLNRSIDYGLRADVSHKMVHPERPWSEWSSRLPTPQLKFATYDKKSHSILRDPSGNWGTHEIVIAINTMTL